jgi:hypothetical protein
LPNEFSVPLKLISKKDPTTKLKALAEFQETLKRSQIKTDESLAKNVLQHWVIFLYASDF